jgi:outer membrane autotransporter protein
VVLDQDGTSDSLEVAGTSTLESGSVLEVGIEGFDAVGDTFTVFSSNAFTSGSSEFSEIVLTHPWVFETTSEYLGNSLLLTVTSDFSFQTYAQAPNTEGVAVYLDDSLTDASGPYLDALNALALSAPAEISEGLDQLNPESYDAQTSTALEWGRKQAMLLAKAPPRCDRFVYPRNRNVKTDAPCGAKGWTPWVVGLGQFGKRTSGSLYKSFESAGGGLVIGADYRLNDRVWLRADLGGGRIDLDIEDDADGQLSSLDLGLASGAQIGNGEVHGLFSYSHGWYETSQELYFLGARTSGESQSDRYSLEIGSSYRFEWQRVYFEPLLSVNYSHFYAGRVEETGAMGMGVNLDLRSYDVVATDLGLRVSADLFKYVYASELLEWADGVWHPELKVSWREAWTDWDRKLSATLVGAPQDVDPFTVQASDAKRGVEIGAHMRFQPLRSRATVAVGYDGFIGDRSYVHLVSATLRVPF